MGSSKSPLADVYHWAQDPLPVQISLWDHFYDADDTDEQLTYTITANSDPAAVSTSIDAMIGYLTLNFSGTPGIPDITVRATDPPGEWVEETFTVYAVDVTGYTVEKREWGGAWTACATGELLWGADEHRWTATYEPASVPVDGATWLNKDWDLRDDPSVPWTEFATADSDTRAVANPAPGDWAIAPRVSFAGGALVVQMTPPRRQPLVTISQVEWAGVEQGDGESNFDADPYLGGYRIFPERNHSQGAVDPSGNPIDQIHDQVAVRVTITPQMPDGYSGTVHFKVFDPDYFQDGGPAGTPSDGDPNEHDPNTHEPNDNFGGLGMSPTVLSTTFSADDWQKSATFTVDKPNAGNNFLMGVHHSSAVLNRYNFMPDGKNVYVMHQGEQMQIQPPYRTDNWLTVWRSLWMELDDMVAPDPAREGPFDGAGSGNDDVIQHPSTPPVDLTQASMQWALIDVKPLPAQYNVRDATPGDNTGTAVFKHNMTAGISTTVSGPVRDEASETRFWVVHQGQRVLTLCPGKDFEQEVFIPTAGASSHGDAVFAGMLFQERQREAVEPSKVLSKVFLADP